MSGFIVAGIQMSCRIGDKQANVDKACAMIEEAASQGARLMVLPEMFNTGYFSHTGHVDPGFWDLAEPVGASPTLERLGTLARQLNVFIIAPFVEKGDRGVYYNSAALIGSSGQVLGCYRKVHIPWSLTGWEKFYFRPGYEFPVFSTPLGRIAIQICYDRDFPEGSRSLALQGAELIALPTGCPRNLASLWRAICRVRAYENGLFVVGVGLTGRTDEEHHEFAGNSVAVAPGGEIIASLEFDEGILLAEVDLGAIEAARRRRFIFRDRRPEVYGLVTRLA
ncbi:MAG: carbon-nitrogen hydrolase family protein [Firmicutes bacterium]|nr:carbon-nitrogen hydrolase family protein [Bacillota bacterium]